MLKLSINQITTRDLPFDDAVDCYARAGVQGISPWRENIEQVGVKQAARLIRDAGLEVPSVCVCGLFTRQGSEARESVINDAMVAIDTASALGAPTVVTVVGGLFRDDKNIAEARAFILDCLSAVLDHAREAGVVLGLEPLHPMNAAEFSVLSTLGQANEWAAVQGDGVGVIVDVYHTWWDPNLYNEIAIAAGAGRLVGFHVSDWLMPTRDLMNDRGLPGDGVIDIAGIGQTMLAAGYEGWMEAEIFSDTLWSGDQRQLPAIVAERMRAIHHAIVEG